MVPVAPGTYHPDDGLSAPPCWGHFFWAQVVTKSPAFPAIILETQGASHGALAKSVSTRVPIQLHRLLGN
jgi:hypothetical protein